MANAAHGVPVPRLRPARSARAAARGWLPVWSPAAALRAVRAALVLTATFAFTDKVIGNLQMATFAAFGSFATLVLSSFAGTRRDKLVAHIGLALAGSVLLTIGTAVSSSTLLAAIVTVPVTFAVFFAGVAGPNAASGVNGALLAYVLPAASPGTLSMIPDRLAGWWLASAVGTVAVLLISPPAGDDRLRAAARNLAVALADELGAMLGGTASEQQLSAVVTANHDLLAQFTRTPYRPTGLAAPDEALANCVEMLEWTSTLLVDAARERADLREASPADRELVRTTEAVLRDLASLFAGSRERPALDRLDRERLHSLASLREMTPDGTGFREAAKVSFHANTIAGAVLAAGADALVASRLADPEWMTEQRRRWYLGGPVAWRAPDTLSRASRRLSRVAAVARRDASLRSVWFVNSVRGSIALAVAVAVADLSSVQHGFWVVLGTLSVLRTNAASTGSTAVRALAGTAIGFVIGGALLVAIGSDSTALWVVLPIAVFVAAYTPGTTPFAIGQAAFTVTVAVLFNLLAPVGWKVGVLRIEDVAIGCGVSVLAGVLFWPRGLAAIVGDDLADAFRSGGAYLGEAVEWASGNQAVEPDGAAAAAAALRLDDALRAFLAERGTTHLAPPELWRLVGGSMRLRLTAHLVAALPRDESGIRSSRDDLGHRAQTLAAWFGRLAAMLGRPHRGGPPQLEPPTFAPADGSEGTSRSPYGIWLCEHLDHLAEHLGELVGPAVRVAELRQLPWWR